MGIMLKVVAFVILTSRAFAEDFTNITTKAIYPNAKVIREEPDGLTLKWVSGDKRGMTKVYFWELPAATQQAFHYDPQSATSHYAETQRKIKENAAEQQAKQQEESRQYASSDLHKTIKKSTASRPYTIVGKILQMKGTSALITEVKEVVAYKVANTGPYTTPLLRDSTKWETQYKYEPMTSDRIYVCGLSPAYVDGQTYQGVVYFSGNYTYTTTQGASATVPRYATNPDLAASLTIKWGKKALKDMQKDPTEETGDGE